MKTKLFAKVDSQTVFDVTTLDGLVKFWTWLLDCEESKYDGEIEVEFKFSTL